MAHVLVGPATYYGWDTYGGGPTPRSSAAPAPVPAPPAPEPPAPAPARTLTSIPMNIGWAFQNLRFEGMGIADCTGIDLYEVATLNGNPQPTIAGPFACSAPTSSGPVNPLDPTQGDFVQVTGPDFPPLQFGFEYIVVLHFPGGAANDLTSNTIDFWTISVMGV